MDEQEEPRKNEDEKPGTGEDAGPIPIGQPDKPRARLEKPGLLEDFDEDADFDRDPAVEAALGTPEVRVLEPEEAPKAAFDDGIGGAKLWTIVGAVLAILALVATGVYARSQAPASVGLALYQIAVHTGTGIVAVYIAALFAEKTVKRVDVTAARMFTAVAAFSAIYHLQIQLVKDWKLEELVLATAAYLVAVGMTFRLDRVGLFLVAGAHFGLWMVVYIGMLLTSYVSRGVESPGLILP